MHFAKFALYVTFDGLGSSDSSNIIERFYKLLLMNSSRTKIGLMNEAKIYLAIGTKIKVEVIPGTRMFWGNLNFKISCAVFNSCNW